MPTATQVARTSFRCPPSATTANVHCSSARNQQYGPAYVETLERFSDEEIAEFKAYLTTIPFDFENIVPSTEGRVLYTEGDVRLFVDYAVVNICYPIILAMVPEGRSGDLRLSSEKSIDSVAGGSTLQTSAIGVGSTARPDVIIFHLQQNQAQKTRLIYEHKGPRALRCIENGAVAVQRNLDNWVETTRQGRKYCHMSGLDIFSFGDNNSYVVLQFEDVTDENAAVKCLIASFDAINTMPLTVREAFLFGAYKSVKAAFGGVRNYSSTAVVQGSHCDYQNQLEYRDPFSEGNGTSATAQQRTLRSQLRYARRTIPDPGPFQRGLEELGGLQDNIEDEEEIFPCENPQLANAAFHRKYLTPPTSMIDSGFSPTPKTRRIPKHALIDGWTFPKFSVNIRSRVGRVAFIGSYGRFSIYLAERHANCQEGRPTTPPLTADLVLKASVGEEILYLAKEIEAYKHLVHLQGYILPYCYGCFINQDGKHFLLLEKIEGKTLTQVLEELAHQPRTDDLYNEVEDLFMLCYNAITLLHKSGRCHGDIRSDNIIIEPERRAVLVDLESSLPLEKVHHQLLDHVGLRLAFSGFGSGEVWEDLVEFHHPGSIKNPAFAMH